MYNEFSVLAVVLNCSRKVKQAVLVVQRGNRHSQTHIIFVHDGTTTEYHSPNQT